MKPLIAISLILITSVTFAQTPYQKIARQNKVGKSDSSTHVFSFDALNSAKVIEHDQAIKAFQKYDSTYWAFIRQFLTASKVDMVRISNNKDSTKITKDGIFLKLKRNKNGK